MSSILNWRSPARMTAVGVVATLILALVVVITLQQTDGAQAVSDNAALIGAVVALGGVFTTQLVNSALENQRAQEAALQKYFEQIGDLIVDPDHPLHHSTPGDNLSTVARAQTLSVLAGLDDPARKRILLQFLYESRLIHKDRPIVRLSGANLFRADLRGADLRETDLAQADLREADLQEADLQEAELREANLGRADLRKAKLGRAILYSAKLHGANLRDASLWETKLGSADLRGVNLREADLENADLENADLYHADLREAVLHRANLRDATLARTNLRRARLIGADLSEAHLAAYSYGKFFKRANLRDAFLVECVLKDAKGLTQKELERASSLEGTIMPDGSTHP